MKIAAHVFFHQSLLSFMLLLILQITGHAQTAATDLVQISLSSNSKSPVWVGQKVEVIVEILSPTFFAGPTTLSLPDIAGAVFYKAEERALVSSKTIQGQSYSVQRHEISFYPQRAGEFEIPAFKVRFGTSGTAGQAAQQHSVHTSALKFSAQMPPGAEHLATLISATALEVNETWQPQPKSKVKVGDAFKRTLIFRAPDIPGMVFPAMVFPDVTGLKLYPARAQVNDKINRGSLTGGRIDVTTYLCEKPGHYSLSSLTIPWWNLNKQEMEKVILPAVEFEVEALATASPMIEDPAVQKENVPWKIIGAVGFTVLIFAGLYWRFRKELHQRVQHWQEHRKNSEAAYFKKILQARNASESLNAINRWFVRSDFSQHASSLSQYAQKNQLVTLNQQVQTLYQAVARGDQKWQATALQASLKSSRAQVQRKTKGRHQPALKSLNPRY